MARHLDDGLFGAPIVCMMYAMKRTNIFLPKPLLSKLRTLSKATGLSVAEHIRRAIDEYLKRQK